MQRVQHGSQVLPGHKAGQRGVESLRESKAAPPEPCCARYHLCWAQLPWGRTCGGWSSTGSRVWLCSVLLTMLCLIPARAGHLQGLCILGDVLCFLGFSTLPGLVTGDRTWRHSPKGPWPLPWPLTAQFGGCSKARMHTFSWRSVGMLFDFGAF